MKRKRTKTKDLSPKARFSLDSSEDAYDGEFGLDMDDDDLDLDRLSIKGLRDDEDDYDGDDDATPRFDLERWQADLAERSLHRQRIRARDLKRGVLESSSRRSRNSEDDESYE